MVGNFSLMIARYREILKSRNPETDDYLLYSHIKDELMVYLAERLDAELDLVWDSASNTNE